MSNNIMPAMLESETPKAYKGFCDYCRLGASNRSLSNLHKMYEMNTVDVPTSSLRTLKEWSALHDWQARIRVYDANIQEQLERSIRERRLSLLDKFGVVVEDAINAVDVSDASLSQVTSALREYLTQSLQLFNEMPTNRHEIIALNANDVRELSTDDLRRRANALIERLGVKSDENTTFALSQDEIYQLPGDGV